MYEVNISLKENQYRSLMYWNLFCCNRGLTTLMLIIYAYGMISVSSLVRNLSQFDESMFIPLAISVLCLVMPIINVTTYEHRIRKTLKNDDIEDKTRKHITMTENGITVLRVRKNQFDNYKWDDVERIYRTKDMVVIFMKNKQVLPIYAVNNAPEALDFAYNKGVEKGVIKKAFHGKNIRLILILITLVGMILGVPQTSALK